MDGKLIAFHCFGTPGPVLTDDERAVLQVLKDARGIFAGDGPNGGMSVSDVCLAFRRESGPPHRATVAEIERMLAVLEANGKAKKLPNGRWIRHE